MLFRYFTLLLLSAAALRAADDGLSITWTNNMLRISGPTLPGETVEINYLEAFCRSGSTHQTWDKSVMSQRSELLKVIRPGKELLLKTVVQPGVEVRHRIRARRDDVDFDLEVRNTTKEFVDVQWFQPCMRVNRFTGRKQDDYFPQCFIFTAKGRTFLDQVPRAEEALYHGGQVYVPAGVNVNDVNPRPISPAQPVNGIIGAVSQDGKYLLASAWDKTQELFQGVIVCVHNDPRIGGMRGGERKHLHGKVYFLPNDPDALVRRYERDFGLKVPFRGPDKAGVTSPLQQSRR